jgi:hypothetical protein
MPGFLRVTYLLFRLNYERFVSWLIDGISPPLSPTSSLRELLHHNRHPPLADLLERVEQAIDHGSLQSRQGIAFLERAIHFRALPFDYCVQLGGIGKERTEEWIRREKRERELLEGMRQLLKRLRSHFSNSNVHDHCEQKKEEKKEVKEIPRQKETERLKRKETLTVPGKGPLKRAETSYKKKNAEDTTKHSASVKTSSRRIELPAISLTPSPSPQTSYSRPASSLQPLPSLVSSLPMEQTHSRPTSRHEMVLKETQHDNAPIVTINKPNETQAYFKDLVDEDIQHILQKLDHREALKVVHHSDGTIDIEKALYMAAEANSYAEGEAGTSEDGTAASKAKEMDEAERDMLLICGAYDLDRFMGYLKHAWQRYSEGTLTLLQATSLTNYTIRAAAVLGNDMFTRCPDVFEQFQSTIPLFRTNHIRQFFYTLKAVPLLLFDSNETFQIDPPVPEPKGFKEWRAVFYSMAQSDAWQELKRVILEGEKSVFVWNPLYQLLEKSKYKALRTPAVEFGIAFALEAIMASGQVSAVQLSALSKEYKDTLNRLLRGLSFVIEHNVLIIDNHHRIDSMILKEGRDDNLRDFCFQLLELKFFCEQALLLASSSFPYFHGKVLEGVALHQYCLGWAALPDVGTITVCHVYHWLVSKGFLQKHTLLETLCERMGSALFTFTRGYDSLQLHEHASLQGKYSRSFVNALGGEPHKTRTSSAHCLQTISDKSENAHFRFTATGASRYLRFFSYTRGSSQSLFGNVEMDPDVGIPVDLITAVASHSEQLVLTLNVSIFAMLVFDILKQLPSTASTTVSANATLSPLGPTHQPSKESSGAKVAGFMGQAEYCAQLLSYVDNPRHDSLITPKTLASTWPPQARDIPRIVQVFQSVLSQTCVADEDVTFWK